MGYRIRDPLTRFVIYQWLEWRALMRFVAGLLAVARFALTTMAWAVTR